MVAASYRGGWGGGWGGCRGGGRGGGGKEDVGGGSGDGKVRGRGVLGDARGAWHARHRQTRQGRKRGKGGCCMGAGRAEGGGRGGGGKAKQAGRNETGGNMKTTALKGRRRRDCRDKVFFGREK